MKKIISFICAAALLMCVLAGCSGSKKLPDSYYTCDTSFKGVQHELYSDATKDSTAVDSMVYTEMPKYVKEDLNSKGANISNIEIHSADGSQYDFSDDVIATVATFTLTVTADGGDIPSGDYELAACFTYLQKSGFTRVYLINYAFIDSEESFKNNSGNSMFDESLKGSLSAEDPSVPTAEAATEGSTDSTTQAATEGSTDSTTQSNTQAATETATQKN